MEYLQESWGENLVSLCSVHTSKCFQMSWVRKSCHLWDSWPFASTLFSQFSCSVVPDSLRPHESQHASRWHYRRKLLHQPPLTDSSSNRYLSFLVWCAAGRGMLQHNEGSWYLHTSAPTSWVMDLSESTIFVPKSDYSCCNYPYRI